MKRDDYPQNVRYGREPVLANFPQTALERTVASHPADRRRSVRKLRAGMSEAHLALIRSLPCCVSAISRGKVDVHHLKGGPAIYERGVGMKSTDRWGVPLDLHAHRYDLEMLGSRNELAWFMQEACLNPYALAKALWCATGDAQRMGRVILHHKLIGIPWLQELRRMRVAQIRADDLKPLIGVLSYDELADITPQQVVACLAQQSGRVITLPKRSWRRV